MDTFFMLLVFIISTSVVLLYLYFYLRYRDCALGFWLLAGFLLVLEYLLDISFSHGLKSDMRGDADKVFPLWLRCRDWLGGNCVVQK